MMTHGIKKGELQLLVAGKGVGKSMFKMGDDDDWMNPPNHSGWSAKKAKPSDREYLIERKKRVPVSGNRAFITQWAFWSIHDTAAERDAELTRLKEAHPSWQLRAKDRNPYLEALCGEFGRSMPA